MRPEIFEALQEEWRKEAGEVSRSRRKGYTRSSDCLSNFKRVAGLCRLLNLDVFTPEGVAVFYLTTKVDRIANILHVGILPGTEDRLVDSCNDANNYIDLLRAIVIEREVNDGTKTEAEIDS